MIGDLITKTDLVDNKLKAISFYDEYTKLAVISLIGTYQPSAKTTRSLITHATPDDTLHESGTLMQQSTDDNCASSMFFTVTKTKNFKLVLSDKSTVAYTTLGALEIRLNFDFPVDLSRYVKSTNTGKSYVVYELNDLDPSRFYYIMISQKNWTTGSIYFDSFVVDDNAIIIGGNMMYHNLVKDEKTPRRKASYRLYGPDSADQTPPLSNIKDSYLDKLKNTKYGTSRILNVFDKQVMSFDDICYTGPARASSLSRAGFITPLCPLLDKYADSGMYSFNIANTDYVQIVGIPMSTDCRNIDVLVDNVLYETIDLKCEYYYNTSYFSGDNRMVLCDIRLQDRKIHKISVVKKATEWAYIDGIVTDKAAYITPIVESTEKAVFTNDNGVTYQCARKIKRFTDISINDMNIKPSFLDIKISGKNRYIIKAGDKYVIPKRSGQTIKTLNSYETIASMPYIDANSSVLEGAITANTFPILSDKKAVNQMHIDINNPENSGVSSTYVSAYNFNFALTMDYWYYASNANSISMESIMWYDYERYLKSDGSIFSSTSQYIFNGYMIPVYIKFKTTSSFVSVWQPVNPQSPQSDTVKLNNIFLVYVNGVLRDISQLQHPTDRTVVVNRKGEIIRIDGLTPNDVVEIVQVVGNRNCRSVYGMAIDKNASITYSHLHVPNYEIVDEATYLSIDEKERNLKIDTAELKTILSSIFTSDNTITEINLKSIETIDQGIVEYSPNDLNIINDNLDETTMYYCGYDLTDINKSTDLINLINGGYKMITLKYNIYGIPKDKSKVYYIESSNVNKLIADKIIDIKQNTKLNTASLEGKSVVYNGVDCLEFTFPIYHNILEVKR